MKNFIIAFLVMALFTSCIGWRVSGLALVGAFGFCTIDIWVLLEVFDYSRKNKPKNF